MGVVTQKTSYRLKDWLVEAERRPNTILGKGYFWVIIHKSGDQIGKESRMIDEDFLKMYELYNPQSQTAHIKGD